MIPLKTIEELINKHRLLENDLSSGNIDKKLFAEKSKEYSDLNEIIKDAKKYISYEMKSPTRGSNGECVFDISIKEDLGFLFRQPKSWHSNYI